MTQNEITVQRMAQRMVIAKRLLRRCLISLMQSGDPSVVDLCDAISLYFESEGVLVDHCPKCGGSRDVRLANRDGSPGVCSDRYHGQGTYYVRGVMP